MLTANIKESVAKFTRIFSKRSNHHDTDSNPNPNPTGPSTYQHLSVIKKLSKAKFPVYLTRSKIDNQNYAMKVFPHPGEEPSRCFKNEARFSNLKHPNIINTLHCEPERESIKKDGAQKISYILMEYAPYGDLFDFITKHGSKLDDKLIRTLFHQIIEGVEYLHQNNVAHLDLKPENLLIGADFNLKIADFDLSYVKGDEKVLSRGTKYYRGPEFFLAGTTTPRLRLPFAADIYSVGVILFIMKSGGVYPHCENTLFHGVDLERLMERNNEEFWRVHCDIQGKSREFYDKEFRQLFRGMVRRNPWDRISIEEIKESQWYNGEIYDQVEFQRKMREILGYED